MESWLSEVTESLAETWQNLASFRTLLLQLVASMINTDDPAADTEGETLGDPQLNVGSSLRSALFVTH